MPAPWTRLACYVVDSGKLPGALLGLADELLSRCAEQSGVRRPPNDRPVTRGVLDEVYVNVGGRHAPTHHGVLAIRPSDPKFFQPSPEPLANGLYVLISACIASDVTARCVADRENQVP